MKAVRCILLLLLSVTILFVGRGIDIVRCAHNCTVKVITCLDDKEHLPMNSCMSVEHIDVSPATLQPTVDFQIVQPMVTVLPVLLAVLLPIQEHRLKFQTINVVPKGPPRSYLRLLCTLLI